MKMLLTLILALLSNLSFGQKLSESDIDQAAARASKKVDKSTMTLAGNPYRNRDNESDSIGLAHAGFSEASQKIFNDLQTEITELQKQLQEKVKRQDDMFMLLCGAAVPPVDPKRVIKDGIQVKPGELILKYRK